MYFFVFQVNVHLNKDKIAQAGWRTYRRPDDKSGGHGVGWSPMIPYTFSVPVKWEEVGIHLFTTARISVDNVREITFKLDINQLCMIGHTLIRPTFDVFIC